MTVSPSGSRYITAMSCPGKISQPTLAKSQVKLPPSAATAGTLMAGGPLGTQTSQRTVRFPGANQGALTVPATVSASPSTSPSMVPTGLTTVVAAAVSTVTMSPGAMSGWLG